MKLKKMPVALAALLFSQLAVSSDYVLVPDMSRLQYQIFQNRVNIRNMVEFGSTWQGCCDKYYVDLSTNEGKAMWSTMLAKMLAKESLYLGVDDKTVPQSRITFIGNW